MFSPVIKQTFVLSPILLTMLGQGMILGSTSSLLSALQAADSPIKISLENASWFVAILGIGNMFGYIISAYCMVVFGRRIAIGVILLPGIAGMLLIFRAGDVPFLICGRLLVGITAGGSATIVAVAIGEYSSPRYRGMFLNLKTALLYFGSMVVHMLGYQLYWRTVVLLSTMPYIIAFFIACAIPESPSWLAQKKRYNESEKIFYQLRGTSEDSVREIEELIRTQKIAKRNPERSFFEKIADFASKFTKKNFLKPLLILVFAMLLLETSGRHIFPAYAMQIITQIIGRDPYIIYYTIAADTLLTVSAMFSSYLIKVMKLRKLLFSTGMMACIVMAVFCSYLFLVAKGYIPKDYPMIPLALLGLYFVLANFGCCPIPLVLIGEILPLEHRAVKSMLTGYFFSGIFTIVLKMMPVMLSTLDIYGAFAVLTLFTALSLLALYFTLPETKNRTLQDIENFFNHGQVRADQMRREKETQLQVICKENDD